MSLALEVCQTGLMQETGPFPLHHFQSTGEAGLTVIALQRYLARQMSFADLGGYITDKEGTGPAMWCATNDIICGSGSSISRA